MLGVTSEKRVAYRPDVAERLAAQGADLAATTSYEFGRFLASEHARWSAAIKAANVSVQ